MVVGGKQRRESSETSRLGNGRAFRFDCSNELLASRAAQPDSTEGGGRWGRRFIYEFGRINGAMAGKASRSCERYRRNVQAGTVICFSDVGRDHRREAL